MIEHLGKGLVFFGMILVIAGFILIFGSKIPFFGRLPGDIIIQKKNFTFYFPLATSILLSAILTLIFWLWPRK